MDRRNMLVGALVLLVTACEGVPEEATVGTDESAYTACPWTRSKVGEGAHFIGPLAVRTTDNGDLVAAYTATWLLAAPEMRSAKLSGGTWTESSLSQLHGAAGTSLGFATHPDGRALIAFAGLVNMKPTDVPVSLWSDVGTASMTTSTLTTTQDYRPHVASAVTADGHEHVLVADGGKMRHFERPSSASAFVVTDTRVIGLVLAFDARAHGNDLHVAYGTLEGIRHATHHLGAWTDELVTPAFSKSIALAIDGGGLPRVAYQDERSAAPATVGLVVKDAAGWSSTPMDAVPSGLGPQPLALALEPSGAAVVAYQDAAAFPSSYRPGALALATLRAGVVTKELASRDGENGAESVALAVDPQGRTHVLYQPGSANELVHLVRAPSTNGACP